MTSVRKLPAKATLTGKIPLLAALVLWIFLISGCASSKAVKTVQPGETAHVGISCRLQDGRIVMASNVNSTTRELAHPIYLPRKEKGDVKLTAVSPGAVPEAILESPFEAEVLVRLAGRIVGMKPGESRQLELTAEDVQGRDEKNYVLSVSRTRLRDKEMRLPNDDFRGRKNKDPEVGDAFTIDPAFPGKVVAVENGTALVRFSKKPGETVETPLGKVRITEDEKYYRATIDAKIGDLVRTGPFVGRITTVDDRQIVIDYRNPFGREKLLCDVTVKSIEEPDKAKGIEAEASRQREVQGSGPGDNAAGRNAEEQKQGGGEKP